MSKRQQSLAEHPHRLRQQPTDSEALLWRALQASQLGQPFRRQAVLLGFIVGFFCPKARLVVEVDGAYHAKRVEADANGDRKLNRAGYRVARVTAQLMHRDLAAQQLE